MTRVELAQLLATIRAYDGRHTADELTLAAWNAIPEIANADYQQALAVVTSWHGTPGTGFFDSRAMVAGLRQASRTSVADIEVDVRAAKARKIIPSDWPAKEALTQEAATMLAAAREHDRAEAERLTAAAALEA
jgi:hypothetical protein